MSLERHPPATPGLPSTLLPVADISFAPIAV